MKGEFVNIKPRDLADLRKRHGLTQLQLATLGRSGIYHYKSGKIQPRRVQDWESGKSRVPQAAWELICAKVKLIEAGVATYDELANEPLVSILFPTDKEFSKMAKTEKSI